MKRAKIAVFVMSLGLIGSGFPAMAENHGRPKGERLRQEVVDPLSGALALIMDKKGIQNCPADQIRATNTGVFCRKPNTWFRTLWTIEGQEITEKSSSLFNLETWETFSCAGLPGCSMTAFLNFKPYLGQKSDHRGPYLTSDEIVENNPSIVTRGELRAALQKAQMTRALRESGKRISSIIGQEPQFN